MASVYFKLGDRGPAVAEIRARLARLGLLEGSRHVRGEDSVRSLMYADDTMGSSEETDPAQWATTALVSANYDDEVEQAIRSFQRQRGITVDGIVGPETFRRLEEARWGLGDRVLSYQPGHPFVGEDVLQLQRQLNRMGFDCGKEDSHFGPLTDRGLREFQRNVGTAADGVAGPHTLRALGRLHRTVGQHSAHMARERYALPKLRTGIAGKTVLVDVNPGAGGTPTGADPAATLAAATAMAREIGRALAAAGVLVVRTESLDAHGNPLDELVRARVSNDSDADLVLSLQIAEADADAPELAVYYYGRSATAFSAAGRAAADALGEALEASINGPCAIDARTWDILRATRMPSVRVCFGRTSGGPRRVGEPDFHRTVAAAVSSGLGAFFAPRPADVS